MSNPTSNFNWQMPTATDLVTDLPADFEVFGQAVDSSMADLLGGTTGQILAKNSNTNMDFVWITNDVGDITAVTAGTGISGGGTSGAVTITNSMATEITASGDIIVGTGSGTFDNLPIGTTGQVLTADTTVSPYKVKWASAAAANGPAFRAYRNGDQTVTGSVETKIQFNVENFDTDSCYDPTTNYRFTPNKAGYYAASTQGVGIGSTLVGMKIFKNGSAISGIRTVTSGDVGTIYCGDLVEMNGTTDYLEVFGFITDGAATEKWSGFSNETWFAAVWIRSL
jgi:hypothetical protein